MPISKRLRIATKGRWNDTREVRSGMKTITSFRPTSSGADGSVARASELNLFSNRFDTAALAPAGSPVD